MNTKGKTCYETPSLDVSYVVIEGCIAASFIQMTPDADNFNKYDWDPQPETESPDIQLLY